LVLIRQSSFCIHHSFLLPPNHLEKHERQERQQEASAEEPDDQGFAGGGRTAMELAAEFVQYSLGTHVSFLSADSAPAAGDERSDGKGRA
jgi:hypothetical protein